jgi:hypothetical protein
MGAGFLPVAVHKGKLYFLLGKERDRPSETARGWADFGGGHEQNETRIKTAAREGAEELSGFLGSKHKIASLLRKKKMKIETENKKYTTYIVPLEYDEKLPMYFNNQISFLDTYVKDDRLNNTTMYEKEEIKWFSCNMLRTHKNKFREFYQEVVGKILKEERAIKNKLFPKKTRKCKHRSQKQKTRTAKK